MPAFLDFSSALPWVLSGFIAGILLSWIFRKISGADARHLKEVEALHATVDDARRAHASLAAANGQLEAERTRLAAEVNQLSPRAALLPQLERQSGELKQALASAQAAADAANKDLAAARESSTAELSALRQDAEVKGSTAKYYEEEYGRLHAAHQALNKDWTSASGLVSKLQSDYAVASRAAEETTRLRSEADSLRAQIDTLRADVAAAKTSGKAGLDKLEADAAARINQLQSLLSAREGDVAQLKAQIAAAPKEDLSAEVSRLKLLVQSHQTDLAAAASSKALLADEVNRLKTVLASAPKEDLGGEVARLKSALDQMTAQERSTAMELHSARTDLSQSRTALEETTRLLGERHGEIEQLRDKLAAVPDVESYRRFKDALDAANRIAAGLPEKT